MASTTREAHPIAVIEDRSLPEAPGGRTRAAMEAVRSYIQESLPAVKV